jgi:para-aminobenzoate synthetase component 1
MGALGTVWPNGDFDLALTIRTFAVAGDRIHVWVGGGVVWDSEPAAEIEESWVKARPLSSEARGSRSRSVPPRSRFALAARRGAAT